MVDDNFINSLPLSSLPLSTRTLLSRLLNPPKVIPNDERIPRDWRGLACKANISSELESFIKYCADKTAKVLEFWQQGNPSATVGGLLEHLQSLDRYDVFDDVCNDLKEKIISGELSGSQQNRPNQIAVQSPPQYYSGVSTNGDSDQITDEDRPGYAHIYDAIILFAEEDKAFVNVMQQRLRNEGFDICTVDNLQVGHTSLYAPVTRLISDRCLRIIIVFSPAFIKSTSNCFFVEYAQAVSIESKQRKLLPIVYEVCELPSHVAFYHKLYYQSEERPMYDFWHKLQQTLASGRWNNQNLMIQNVPHRANGITITSPPPQIQIEHYPSGSISDLIKDGLFLDRSTSLTTMDTLPISTLTTEDSKSLGNISQLSANSEKKKKKNPLSKLLRLPFGKKNKKAMAMAMVAD